MISLELESVGHVSDVGRVADAEARLRTGGVGIREPLSVPRPGRRAHRVVRVSDRLACLPRVELDRDHAASDVCYATVVVRRGKRVVP